VSEGSGEFGMDPWAWLNEIHDEEQPDLSGFRVVAVVPSMGGDSARCRAAIQAQDAPVATIVTELSPDQSGDWIWVVPDDTEPDPDALSALLRRVLKQHDAAVVGSLLLEPRRRGSGKLVSDWAQTISANGRLRTLTEPGELYQGQLVSSPALGVPGAGMLVRGDVWRFLGGFNMELPASHRGLDLGWRANLTGYRVMAEPDAQLTNYADFGDAADSRAAGLALTVANTAKPWRWLVATRLALVTALVSLGFLLGKDLTRAGEEIRGLWRWVSGRSLRQNLSDQLYSLPITPATRAVTRSLQPSRWSGVRRAVGLAGSRLGGWLETFTGRGDAVSLDEMIGDDFADVGGHHSKVPLVAIVTGALVIGALVAARNSIRIGSLTGPELLPAPQNWTDLIASYTTPVAGSVGAGAPWAGLLGLFSLITLGNPDWLLTVLLVLAVPLSWVLSFRLLRRLVRDRYLAGVAAFAYALVPVLVGGLNSASLGVAGVSVLLPVAGYSLLAWVKDATWSWRAAGSVAFWVTLICALVPLFWLLALTLALWYGLRNRSTRTWLQWGAVLAAPLLGLVGPWGADVLRYPGRLLTGVEPILAPDSPVPGWEVAIGHSASSAAPLWLSIAFFLISWTAAFLAAWRRPSVSLPPLSVAAGATVVAVGITRLAVQVPPGDWTRPQALEWQVLVGAALILAAVGGLDGIGADLADKALGLRHLASLILVALAGAAVVAVAGWWVIGGQLGLTRTTLSQVPIFVQEAQVSHTPGRTMTLRVNGDTVQWALSEGDFSRLGDAERGLAFAGDSQAEPLAASVASRLVGGSGDDQLLPDLVHLGVSYITLVGGNGAQEIAINNTPGLGIGTGSGSRRVWAVPGSAIAVVVDGSTFTATGNGEQIAAGADSRTLLLAEPVDSRRTVSVGGVRLDAVDSNQPGSVYRLGSASGDLQITFDSGFPWWLWIQSLGLLVLAVMAAPAVRRRAPAEPRRIAGGEQ
jgi:hypothetical protein